MRQMFKGITKEQIEEAIAEHKTIWPVSDTLCLSHKTLIKAMKFYGIKSPPGFYSKQGNARGRQPGFKRSKEQNEKMSIMFSGENNPFYGKKHSEETRKKMRENHADYTGENSPVKKWLIKNPENHKILSDAAVKKWASHTEEERKRISETFSAAQCNSEKNKHKKQGRNHHSGHHTSSKCGTVFLRSSWEKNVAQLLDKCEAVSAYYLEKLTVPYRNKEGEQRYCRPDFLVILGSGKRMIVEVKPIGTIHLNSNFEKIQGTINYCKGIGVSFALFTKEYVFNDEKMNNLFMYESETESTTTYAIDIFEF